MEHPLSSADLLALRVGLFIPATERRFLLRAHERGADGIVLDLEDSIAPARKEEARLALAAAVGLLRPHGLAVICRVNGTPAAAMETDVEAALQADIDCLMLPKCDTAEDVLRADRAIDAALARLGRPREPVWVLPVIESPLALMHAWQVAQASPRVAGLVFGGEDFSAALGISSEGADLKAPAQQIALAARARGLAAFGLPGSIQALDDAASYTALARQARSIGFTGSFCVHPAQVGPIRLGFLPTEVEIDRARATVAAAAGQPEQGAYAVDGRMVDAPVVEQARRLLAGLDRPG
jgi:citrate lyase subunit beta/citryl-CoA lyase